MFFLGVFPQNSCSSPFPTTNPQIRSESPTHSRKERLLKVLTYPMAKLRQIRLAAMEAGFEKERCRLGLDSWNGFAWAEDRQNNRLRVKRAWDIDLGQWVFTKSRGTERSVSPCDGREIDEEGDALKEMEEEYFKPESILAVPTRVASSEEIRITRISTSRDTDGSNYTIHQSNGMAGRVVPSNDDGVLRQSNAVSSSSRVTWMKGLEALDFWKLRKRQSKAPSICSSDRRSPILPTSIREITTSSATTTNNKINGFGKLLDSVDNERVDKVQHIWSTETYQWTHVRTHATRRIDLL